MMTNAMTLARRGYSVHHDAGTAGQDPSSHFMYSVEYSVLHSVALYSGVPLFPGLPFIRSIRGTDRLKPEGAHSPPTHVGTPL